MSMINDQTQFIFIDEISAEILTASQAKILLQGGQVTVSRKNQDPETVDNQAGEYRDLFLTIFFSQWFALNLDFLSLRNVLLSDGNRIILRFKVFLSHATTSQTMAKTRKT